MESDNRFSDAFIAGMRPAMERQRREEAPGLYHAFANAAGPRLLAALKELVACHECGGFVEPDPEVLQECRDAIYEAEHGVRTQPSK